MASEEEVVRFIFNGANEMAELMYQLIKWALERREKGRDDGRRDPSKISGRIAPEDAASFAADLAAAGIGAEYVAQADGGLVYSCDAKHFETLKALTKGYAAKYDAMHPESVDNVYYETLRDWRGCSLNECFEVASTVEVAAVNKMRADLAAMGVYFEVARRPENLGYVVKFNAKDASMVERALCELDQAYGHPQSAQDVARAVAGYLPSPAEGVWKREGARSTLEARNAGQDEVLAAAHCADQNGGWQTAECTLPFELTIDCPEGADAEFDIRCRALAPTAEPMQDADGEYRALEWGVTISVEGKIYRAYALDCCTDGYSTRYQSACKGRTLQTVELVNLCRESETRRETLPLPEATGEVVALWARVEGCTAAPEGDGLLAEGRLGLTLLTKMGDGEYYSFDRTMELQRQLPGGEDCRWEAGLECRGCRWEQTGNELSLTCELVWQGAICRTRRLAVLEDITVDEAAPKENRMPRGLYIYMAEEGESLWEVARRYNTSEARIREDNGEMGECCPAGPLLIPV